MQHYRITIEGYPVGAYRIYKNGAFFRDRRFYSKERAEKFAKAFRKEGKVVQVSLYREVKFQNSRVWDEVTA